MNQAAGDLQTDLTYSGFDFVARLGCISSPSSAPFLSSLSVALPSEGALVHAQEEGGGEVTIITFGQTPRHGAVRPVSGVLA